MTVQQPMARGACFECGETGHYARECPRSRQGSRVQTSRPPALPARGGGYSSRGGSQSGRGGHQPSRGGHQSGRGSAQSVRGGSQAVRGGRGGTQSEGGRAHFYAFSGRPEAEASDAIITDFDRSEALRKGKTLV
ncbi:uncharacterized protein LOC132048004 [Lycium ferocissimum]|uniref:uncharacterized protein LOC132048004 n=1 Tax=Lycium ferocissimum TaxID=112874 RepID=UPI002815D9DD|nr:uncharacterized protein LOC132048004 [Lycium ferocissimum]